MKRFIPLNVLCRVIESMPPQTVLALILEGMARPDAEADALSRVKLADRREGVELAIWRPFKREQLLKYARDILSVSGLRADDVTLIFWLDRIGSSLDRLQTEARRLKLEFSDGVINQDRLEDVFATPHVHEETIWQALRAVVQGDVRSASAALQVLVQSMDALVVTGELSRLLLCLNHLAPAGSDISADEIFLRDRIAGKRRQDKLLQLASHMSQPIPMMASRLLALDLLLKRSKTAVGRQEAVLRSFLSLCNKPQPTA